MKTKIFLLIFFSFLFVTSCSQTKNQGENLNLNFEEVQNGRPSNWYIYPQKDYSVFSDSATVKSGKYSVVIEYTGDSAYSQPITLQLPNNYEGKIITLSGYIKTENVDGWAGLWMRIDPNIAFDNMQNKGVTGTTDWKRYEISLAMDPAKTQQIFLGGQLAGKGKMWLDDLHLSIDDKDISEAKICMDSFSKNEIKSLKKYVYPLRTFEPDGGSTKDLHILDQLIGNNSVVALGEVSHGSSEIYKMKNRIIQYIAENKGFNIFSIEANMPEAYKLNDYTVRGEGDPKKLIAGMYFWTWNTEEMLNMVEWMHKFNQPKQRIEFTGFDMQFYSGAIDEIHNKFKENKEVECKLADLKKTLDEISYRSSRNNGLININENEKNEVNSILSFIQNRIETLGFNQSDKNWLQQNIEVIRQYTEKNSYHWRDKCMADNFMWIKNNNPNSKFIIWAHNAHIMKTDSAMGFYLLQKLGNNYTNFGFTFFDGNFTAAGYNGLTSYKMASANPGTLEYILNHINEPIFILDLKKIKSDNNKDTEWLMKQLAYRSVGAIGGSQYEFQSRKIIDDFDYLIFIKTSSPSHLLPTDNLPNPFPWIESKVKK